MSVIRFKNFGKGSTSKKRLPSNSSIKTLVYVKSFVIDKISSDNLISSEGDFIVHEPYEYVQTFPLVRGGFLIDRER